MATPRFASVDEYLASLDPPKGATLQSVISFILGEFPELQCKISWNVPQVHRDGTYVFGVSAAEHHLSLSPWSTQIIDDFAPRFDGYVVRKNLVQVPVDWDLDTSLLRDLVTARLSEIDASDE